MSPWRLVLCLPLLLPTLGFAQTPDESDEWTPYTPPAEETAPPPPLVPAPPLPQPPPPQPAPSPPPPSQASEAEAPKGEIIPRNLTPWRATPDNAALRLVVSPWSGVIVGMMGMMIGSIPTALVALPFCGNLTDFDEDPPCAVAIGTGLALTYAGGVTAGVALMGKVFGGKGDLMMTFFSALAGAAVGAGIGIASQSVGVLILGMALGPIIGATVAYELSHSMNTQPSGLRPQARSGFGVMPVVGTTPRGGILGGLAGRF